MRQTEWQSACSLFDHIVDVALKMIVLNVNDNEATVLAWLVSSMPSSQR